MKKILVFIMSLLMILLFREAGIAQSAWQENTYYNEQGQSDIICGNCYSVFVGYDVFNRPVYSYVQNCQQRNWHSWYGKRGGYFWICNGYRCFWEYKYEERTWWYFTWYNFTRNC